LTLFSPPLAFSLFRLFSLLLFRFLLHFASSSSLFTLVIDAMLLILYIAFSPISFASHFAAPCCCRRRCAAGASAGVTRLFAPKRAAVLRWRHDVRQRFCC
jgi:hypothetical protein